jgi:transposase-like protein
VAVGVNSDGRREVLGMAIGPSGAEPFWTEFLRKLARRGLRGVKLVISDAHEGIKAAVARCCTPPGNAAGCTSCATSWRMPAAKAGAWSQPSSTAFVQDDPKAARTQWRQVADQLRPKVPKLAALMDEAEADVLAFMTFPKDHRPKIHSINPLERLNAEIKRRTDVVGLFPNEDAITRLIGALLLEQNDEWGRSARQVHEPGNKIAPLSDDPIVKLPVVAA